MSNASSVAQSIRFHQTTLKFAQARFDRSGSWEDAKALNEVKNLIVSLEIDLALTKR